jgi:hypothetical protein
VKVSEDKNQENMFCYKVFVAIDSIPWNLERCGPAIDLALKRINREFLDHHKIFLNKVQAR